MEFSFSDEPKKGGTPATKVYSAKKKAKRPQGASGSARTRAAAGEAGAAKDSGAPQPITAASRIGLMFSGFLFAGMVLFTLTGYERIARAYADINTINSDIDETELRIKALDVQIECAVTIQDAQETAERYGMLYPTQSQYVKIGSAIPISGLNPSGVGPGETVQGEAGIGQTVAPAAPVATDAPVSTDAPASTDAPVSTDAPTEDTPSDD